ncbi:MAG: hypothetical protein PHT07_10990 [Paludibacter sp.]|nr:hypothetical protein [Paludibacter sp.]
MREMINYIPKYFTSKAIFLYLGVLSFCSVLFFSHTLPLIWMIFGITEVLGFFYFSNLLTKKWSDISPKLFIKRLFTTALIIRLAWVIFSYFFYISMTGKPFEFASADAFNYDNRANWIKGLFEIPYYQPYFNFVKEGFSDAGYPTYLAVLYYVTNSSILIARLLKALYSAYTCVLIYKLATRNFGGQIGRMAAIFCMLMPNLIYYTGLHVKEVEMVLLTVLFVDRTDLMLRNKNFNFAEIAPPILLAASLFFLRTVLGATALFALFSALMFSSTKVVGSGKRIVLIVWILGTVGYFIGGSLSTEVEQVWNARENNQQQSMDWRSKRDNGNKFSRYASSAVFAPVIFVIPLPTIVNTPAQENQQLINGGNYVKNIMAFFVLLALVWVIRNQKWRDYILIGSFTIGYLIVIAMSAFAQSERFHQPALPFLLIMAAFGISKVTNKSKIYFTWYMLFIFAAIVAWSWFKLAGRGMA